MPRRMLDGNITRSASLCQITRDARLTFINLITLCCDKGRYSGILRVLHANLYPQDEDVTTVQVALWMSELEIEGLIHPYQSEGIAFLHLPKWDTYQRLRVSNTIWPDPADSCNYCVNPAAKSRRTRRKVAANPRPEVEVEVEVEVEEKKKVKVADKSPTGIPSWAISCSTVLVGLLREVPGASIKSTSRTTWAKQIAKIPNECPQDFQGEAIYEEVVESAILWALGPENLGQPYEVVIRSGGALREKWSKLVQAARRKRQETQPQEDFHKHIREKYGAAQP